MMSSLPHGTSWVLTRVTHMFPRRSPQNEKLISTCPSVPPHNVDVKCHVAYRSQSREAACHFQSQSCATTCPARGKRKGPAHLWFCDEILSKPLGAFLGGFKHNQCFTLVATFIRFSPAKVPMLQCCDVSISSELWYVITNIWSLIYLISNIQTSNMRLSIW